MEVVNYTEFRKSLTRYLNKVNDDAEIVVVSRSKGKNVVVMSLEEYNAIQETLHITKSAANRKRLDRSIAETEKGKSPIFFKNINDCKLPLHLLTLPGNHYQTGRFAYIIISKIIVAKNFLYL